MRGTAEIIQSWREVLAEAKAKKDKSLVMSATFQLKKIARISLNTN